MTYGITPTGFNKKNLDTIKTEIQDDLREEISPKLNFLESSRWGQMIGVFGDKLRELWDVAEAVYRAFYPDSASDESLDNVASITGALRLDSTKSTVPLDRLSIDDGVTIPVGSIVSIGPNGARFKTTEAVSNSSGVQATVSTTAKSEDKGAITGYAGTIDTIQTPISGWSGAAALTCGNAELYLASLIVGSGRFIDVYVDGGAAQRVSFPNIGHDYSATEAANQINNDVTGVNAFAVGTKVRVASLTEGEGSSIRMEPSTPVQTAFNWSLELIKGFNSNDAVVGREVEEDPAFRLRREELLRATGAGTVEAIRAGIRALENVSHVSVFENDTDYTSSDGLPPHSVAAIVQGGDEQEIADELWRLKGAGIATHGSISKTVTDSQGILHTIKFSRPDPVRLYIDLTVQVDPDLYPVDGDTQVEAVLAAKALSQGVGADVVALQYKCEPLEVTGVLDVPVFKIDTVFPPTGTTNIVVDFDELAELDTSDINVTVTT